MNETHPDLEGNRFEAMYQQWRNRPRKPKRWGRRLLWLLAALVAIEAVSLVAIFSFYRMQGIRSDRLLDQFYVTRYLVSPWLFQNPVKQNTKATYLGLRTNACVAARWMDPDPLLGWRLAPSVGLLKQPYRVDDVTGWRFTNEQGFASAGEYQFVYAKPKPRGTYRIIVTGASSVEGDGAEEPKLNLVAQLAAALSDGGARLIPAGFERIEVINGGVGGYQSSQEYLNLITELVKYEPDLIISYGGTVDLARARIEYDRYGRAMDPIRSDRHEEFEQYLRQSASLLTPFSQFAANVSRATGCFLDNLALSYFTDKIIERSKRLIGVGQIALQPKKARDDAVPVNAALSAYKNSIRLMEKAAEIYGFRISFILQPVMGSDDKPLTKVEKEVFDQLSPDEIKLRRAYFAKARDLYQELAREESADHRFCFSDLTRIFDGVTERVWDDTFHILGSGNRIVARRIVEQLQVCKQLPQ